MHDYAMYSKSIIFVMYAHAKPVWRGTDQYMVVIQDEAPSSSACMYWSEADRQKLVSGCRYVTLSIRKLKRR